MGSLICRLVFQPPIPTYTYDNSRYAFLRTPSNRRIAYFYHDRRSPITILFSHGNAEDIGLIYDWFGEVSHRLNVNIMSFDYAGYGLSTGECNEMNCYEDITTAFHYLTERRKTPSTSIILYGRSLGSGPVTYLGARQSKLGQPVGGIILQSPLLSVYRVVLPLRYTFNGDMFSSIDRVKDIESPITVIHGTGDEVVPFWHGEALYLACKKDWRMSPLWVAGAGHNNLEMLLHEDNLYFESLQTFVDICKAVKEIRDNDMPDHLKNGAGIINTFNGHLMDKNKEIYREPISSSSREEERAPSPT